MPSPPPIPFLPMSRAEMQALGWDCVDVLIVTGDAYADHPSFGAAVIGRVLVDAGFRTGIVAQPDWHGPDDFLALGRPRLFAGVTAGAMDSMVANYTANRKIRRDDAYSPDGAAGRRPNYATIVYTNLLRQAFKGLPVVLGGIEASLRRFAHYDYWKDAVRRSILLDAKADLIVAGMGERQAVEIARRLAAAPEGAGRDALHGIPGTVESLPLAELDSPALAQALRMPSFEEVAGSPRLFLKTALELETAVACRPPRPHAGVGPAAPPIVQAQGDRLIVEWAPIPLAPAELDAVYALPFQRRAHPAYASGIPALEPVRFSVTSHRGCFGGCTFCALALHQGRHVTSRSASSVLRELEGIARHPDFKGTVSDLGGPSANMYGMRGRDAERCARCRRPSCLHPAICGNLDADHSDLVRLLEEALALSGIRHLFTASGVRYDLLLKDPGGALRPDARAYLRLLAGRLTGGHLSVAPEHASQRVLDGMRKPAFALYEAFARLFAQESARVGKEQYLIPYFIASFPGSTDADMESVRDFLRRAGRRLQQIQDFLPGPLTVAAAMYHAGLDWQRLEPIEVAKTESQRRRQRDCLVAPGEREGGGNAAGRLGAGARKRPEGGAAVGRRSGNARARLQAARQPARDAVPHPPGPGRRRSK